MDMIKKLFPFSFKSTNVRTFVFMLVSYTLAHILLTITLKLLGMLWIPHFLINLVGYSTGLYIQVGIVFTILHFVGVLK